MVGKIVRIKGTPGDSSTSTRRMQYGLLGVVDNVSELFDFVTVKLLDSTIVDAYLWSKNELEEVNITTLNDNVIVELVKLKLKL